MTRKTKEVEILGENVYLSERSAQDIFTFLEMVSTLEDQDIPFADPTGGEQDEFFKSIYINTCILETSLGYCIRNLKIYQILKKIRCKRKFRRKNLLKHLSVKQLTELAQCVVSELEGLAIDEGQIKKKANKKSAEQSETP